jgi:hypothetical protein
VLEKFFSTQAEEAADARMKDALGGENALLFGQWKKLQHWQGIQARMPFEFTLK